MREFINGRRSCAKIERFLRGLRVGLVESITIECLPTRPRLHAQAGPVSGLHRRLYTGASATSVRSRYATPLRRHPAFGAPDDSHPRTRRPHSTPARHAAQHRGPRSSGRPTRVGASDPTIKNMNVLARVFDGRGASVAPKKGNAWRDGSSGSGVMRLSIFAILTSKSSC